MNATQLLEHFDRLAEAPNAVPRLRRFILDLAVRGKLVEQDDGDEPAIELLRKIGAAKKRRVREGSLREQKVSLPMDVNDSERELPRGWEWARMSEVIKLWNGFAFKSGDFTPDGIPVIRIGDLQNGEITLLGAVCVTELVASSVGNEVWIPEDALLIAMSGATTGKVAVNNTGRRVLLNQRVGRIEVFLANRDFVRFFFETIIAKNLSISFGTAIPNLSAQQINDTVIAIPPLAEQHRIVAKVDELMALCDQFEATQQDRERRRDHLAAASLQRLNQPAADTTPEAQREHARFHLHHLPRLTTRPEHIKAMRQTIFDLACGGKLSSLASVNQSNSPAIVGLDSGLSLPAEWGWKKIGDVADLLSGKAFKAEEYSKTGLRLFQIANVSFGVTKWDVLNYLPEGYADKLPELILKAGDLLVALNRPLLNRQIKAAILTKSDLPAILYQRVGKFLFLDNHVIDPQFFLCYLRSMSFIDQLESNMQGSDQPFINKSQLMQFGMPLPPITEQHRVVAKVDQLMALCDQLEAQLTTTQTDSRRLLEAVLDAALVK